MIKSFSQILKDDTSDAISAALQAALERTDEAPFWALKTMPLAEALLSVLVPLREQHLLFTPEGDPQAELTPELLLAWSDLVSLKALAFTLQQSNDKGRLERTKYPEKEAGRYRAIDLSHLGRYLGGYTVNLENEALDFPIAHYNLHIGIAGALAKLMR